MHAATAIVASPVWDLAVPTSVVAVEVPAGAALVVVVEASEVAVEAAAVEAVVAGECCESKYQMTGARI
jgi:hypothetical protein